LGTSILERHPPKAHPKVLKIIEGLQSCKVKGYHRMNIQAEKAEDELKNAKGLVIGLSLVQEIIKLHRGEVHIDSEVRKGTVFTVMLPKSHF
jgi:signal transduction histidine kinase